MTVMAYQNESSIKPEDVQNEKSSSAPKGLHYMYMYVLKT